MAGIFVNRLPPAGYPLCGHDSNQETWRANAKTIGAVMDSIIPAVKAALHRDRARLREIQKSPTTRPVPTLAARSRLAAYVDRFNPRHFDAVRNMLADEVQPHVVALVD